MNIAFQGEHGAYSEAAVIEHYPDQTITTLPCESFELVFAAVSESRAELGFIPIENSVAGSIHQNYDLLLRNSLWVVGEHSLRVSHCLIGLPGARLEKIRNVISHPQALAQCEQKLRAMGNFRTDPVYDTAGSVKMIRALGDATTAAIASRRAAEIYQMDILADNLEDNPYNFTRFLIISPTPVEPETDAKTSIVFSLKNQPGALFRSLSALALRDIDLTKIESRPLVGKPWEYLFYIDFLGSTQDISVRHALDNLSEYAITLRVLGSYPCFRH
jgi:prephenate dehydratase